MTPNQPSLLMQRIVERENLQRALKQVRRNKGAPGVDGMTVGELPDYLRKHWPQLRAQLVSGCYRPQPVRRVLIPKSNGKQRKLGIPTVVDRFLQQAIAQVLGEHWESRFHPDSYGFRPRRSAHQAVRRVQAFTRAGCHTVVDLDLQSFFDEVNHDRLMASLTRFIGKTLRLRVNPEKSAVARAHERPFLGFVLTRRDHRIRVSDNALKKLKATVRVSTRRTRGHAFSTILHELRRALLGWKAYFDISEVLSPLRELDKWIRRKLRCYVWKQWGRAGYRRLRQRGVPRILAWNTAKSAHGPWRLSPSPALYHALPTRYFRTLGLPELAARRG